MTRKLIWADEFDRDGAPDPDKWTYTVGGHGFGNDELQFYTDRRDENANAVIKNGKLRIILRREDYENRQYTSGRIKTAAAWQYGRIDVSAKLPSGRGTWPAIWMLGADIREVGWPDCGEIDIMEHVGRAQNVVHFSLHSKRYNHKNNTHLTLTKPFAGVSEGFHLYSAERKEDEITFLFDNEPVVTWRNGQDGRDTDKAGWPFNAPFFLILNVAFGGGFGGDPDPSCLPQVMEVDFVRVYG